MKKTFKSYLAIWAILVALFNVIVFVSGGWNGMEQYTPPFWIGYAFIMVAFIGQLLCATVAFSAENLTKLFYNIPLISISWTGLIVSFVFGGLCMFLPPVLYWVGIIVCLTVLAINAISLIKASVVAEAVSETDRKIKVQTFFVKSLTVDAEGLMARTQNDEIKAECKKVYEAVRYSDPMSNDALVTTESQIRFKFAELTSAVQCNDLDMVAKMAREVCILVDERNKKCKLLK